MFLGAQVEEGLCQLVALLWLEREVARLDDPRHASFLAEQIRTDASEVYGGGVRAALAAYHRYGGLGSVLSHVRETGAFPI